MTKALIDCTWDDDPREILQAAFEAGYEAVKLEMRECGLGDGCVKIAVTDLGGDETIIHTADYPTPCRGFDGRLLRRSARDTADCVFDILDDAGYAVDRVEVSDELNREFLVFDYNGEPYGYGGNDDRPYDSLDPVEWAEAIGFNKWEDAEEPEAEEPEAAAELAEEPAAAAAPSTLQEHLEAVASKAASRALKLLDEGLLEDADRAVQVVQSALYTLGIAKRG